ncbi:MAG: class I SAM-dependent methyltransferase [Clostridiales bacterium]|nr:class I SAM-dependent methyltransferase [Clostridiales bacterium]
MAFNWKKDIREQSANTIMLLDECHFHYLSQGEPRKDFALVLKAYPHIAWYISHKMPELKDWIGKLNQMVADEPLPADIDNLVGNLLESMEDWIIYVTTPDDYHRQSFVGWDEKELTSLTDYTGKTVVDIGSGTGKQAFAVAKFSKTVYCVEPVWNLRRYLKNRANEEQSENVFVVDGIIQNLPFPANFADITISGHVVGDDIVNEIAEMERITKPTGMIILCPGNTDTDNDIHKILLESGYSWSRFLEPGDDFGSGYKRKYWKVK